MIGYSPFDLAYLAAAPVLLPWLAYRALFRARGRRGWAQKLGAVPRREEGRPRVWVHAVSVGEVEAARTLVKALDDALAARGGETVVSALTDTGREAAGRRFGQARTFFFPVDLTPCVARTLARIRPTALVLMELEIWPNVIRACVRLGIPVVVANGRISERAARRYRRFAFAFRGVFRSVSAYGVQHEEYAERLEQLGVDPGRIRVTGNMKYDTAPAGPDPDARAEILKRLALPPEAPVIVGGSTHPGEETALLGAYRELLGAHPDLRLVLAPRHPQRFSPVAEEIRRAGFTCRLFSEGARPGGALEPRDVILVDAMGVLGAVYQAATVAFIGGSLIHHGGQNVMESAALGVATVVGPHTFNFREVCRRLAEAGALAEAGDAAALSRALGGLLSDRARRAAMGQAARRVVSEGRGATARNLELILDAAGLAAFNAKAQRTP